MKARTIAATVLALSLAGAVATCAGTAGKMANARVSEKTLIGDASAAAGTEIRFGGGIPTKLGWLHQYTFGSADVQSTTFSRETEEDRTTYSQDLYLSVDSCAIKGETLPLLQELAAENADVAVYNADGLAYFGRLYSNLQEWTDDRDFTNWMEQIKPGKRDAKTYYSEDSRNVAEAYVSWLAVRFARDADAR